MPTPHTNEGQTVTAEDKMRAAFIARGYGTPEDMPAAWDGFVIGWQACTAQSAETIARLEAENARLITAHRMEEQNVQAAYQRAASAELDSKRLRDALEAVFSIIADPDIPGMPGSPLELAREALAQPLDTSALDAYVAEKTATPKWEPLTHTGQIKEGCKVRFKLAGSEITATACAVLRPGTDVEEIIYNRKKNHYFITSMVLDGSSSHKDVEFLPPSPNTQGVE